MDKPLDAALVWFRRDLRADDQAALHHALKAARRVWCAFVFDTAILDALPRADRRVEFIRDSVVALDRRLGRLGRAHGVDGAGLIVRHGDARAALPALAARLGVQAVYTNHDDEPAALARDAKVRGALAGLGIVLHTGKDQLVFERNDVLSAAGTPYTVFTPYRRAWLEKLAAEPQAIEPYAVAEHAGALAPRPADEAAGIPTLEAIGFRPTNLHELALPPGEDGAHELLADFLGRIDDYAEARDFPAVKGPSYLGTHLRFGTVSVRRLVREAWQRQQAGSRGAQAWLAELVWREFFQQLLHHHPHVAGGAFKPAYDAIRFEHGKRADERFAAWSEGRTGYPLVDAAIAQIRHSGYMHNRLRMVTASFLVKDLGVHWQRGEAWFAERLNDFDLASNNGGWQWAAGSGCDAQPWFRVFNPVAQSKRFDPQGRFIRRYLPQLARLPDALIHAPWKAKPADLEAAGLRLGVDYPEPIVDHDAARRRTLERYAPVRGAG